MQMQFITTREELQAILNRAVKTAMDETINDRHADPGDGIEIIDTKELCERLAITQQSVIRWRHKGKIPFLQIGSTVRFNFPAVVKALEVSRKKGGRVS